MNFHIYDSVCTQKNLFPLRLLCFMSFFSLSLSLPLFLLHHLEQYHLSIYIPARIQTDREKEQ